MRENEEALIKENEEALREAEAAKENPEAPIPGSIDDVDEKVNGVKKEEIVDDDGDKPMKDAVDDHDDIVKMEMDAPLSTQNGKLKNDGQEDDDEKMGGMQQHEPEQVLSH